MATGVIPWEDNSLQHVGFVTGNHAQKSQSPVTPTGKLVVEVDCRPGVLLGKTRSLSNNDDYENVA